MSSLRTHRAAAAGPVYAPAAPAQYGQILVDARAARLTVGFTSSRGQAVTLDRTALTQLALMESRQTEFESTYGVSAGLIFGALQDALQRGERSTVVNPFPPAAPKEPVPELPPRGAAAVVSAPREPSRLPEPRVDASPSPQRALSTHITFRRLPEEMRSSIEQAIEADPTKTQHFYALAKHYAVGNQSLHTRDAMFQQVLRQPTVGHVRTMQRLAEAPWFGALELPDRLRAVRVIGYASEVAEKSADPIQKGLLSASLDSVLGLHPTYSVYFENLEGAELANAQPRCDCRRDDHRADSLTLDRLEVAPNREPVGDEESRAKRLALEALTHEVSHLANRDKANGTFQNFLLEYDSEYVALHARYGRPPTRREMYTYARVLVVGEGYSLLEKLRTSVDQNGQPTEGAQQITRFMNKFFATPFPVTEILAEESLPKDHMPPNPHATAPAPGSRVMYDALTNEPAEPPDKSLVL